MAYADTFYRMVDISHVTMTPVPHQRRRASQARLGAVGEPTVEQVSGIYRQSIQLASGSFVMRDDGLGSSLVPWKPVIQEYLGQQLSAIGRGSSVSWNLGRQRGMGI